MDVAIALPVILLGALGVLCRFALSTWAGKMDAAPQMTMAINVAGSFVIGVLAAWGATRLSPAWRVSLMTGFLGGFTTFSAFSLEAWTLYESGKTGAAIAYACASPALGIAAAAVGLIIGRSLL